MKPHKEDPWPLQNKNNQGNSWGLSHFINVNRSGHNEPAMKWFTFNKMIMYITEQIIIQKGVTRNIFENPFMPLYFRFPLASESLQIMSP